MISELQRAVAVRLPAGAFTMGVAADDKFATDTERPAHQVTFAHPIALVNFGPMR